jgi:hypothetical protein
VIIQFGHNDNKDDPARHTDPFTTYAAVIGRESAHEQVGLEKGE